MLKPTVDFESMIENADSAVETLTPEEVEMRLKEAGTLLIDIRDIRELERDGKIPGSKHVPRGMLEFWIHPQSPYFKDYFNYAKEIILHCNRGWRSALAAKALDDIGIKVSHMAGGYGEWKQKNLSTEDVERRS